MLKYQSECDKIGSCPVDNEFSEKSSKTLYRFVHDDALQDERNFLPVSKIDPTRFSNGEQKDRCLSWALSFFDSEENARKRFKELKTRNKQIGKRIGAKIASASLKTTFGLSDTPSSSGHISLFEYRGVDLVPHFTMVGDI